MVFGCKTFLVAIVSTLLLTCQADFVPELAKGEIPTAHHVKESISPPKDQQLYNVFYAKGNRIYQCNPEKRRFMRWYNVQTQAFLYPTKGRTAPFDVPGFEIGQITAAPLNKTQQMSDPEELYTTAYYYPDGSWYATGHPVAGTSQEEGRTERGDAGVNLDDHLTRTAWTSTDGYFSHADYVVRLNALDGAHPDKTACTVKGSVLVRPFTAYMMLYAGPEKILALEKEEAEWNALVEKTRVA
ncbi:hypothetical protein BC941DRAFT_350963 [Chlamydoabsidia padenii]|nr:hypothetical protein BC941DRAFT_350963 [Chlamydoabsidia padenii]